MAIWTAWNYNGDVGLRHGGFYWREDGADDYVVVVDVTPCSAAGGPDNLFWIAEGSVYITPERAATALESCDMTYADATRGQIVESIMAYYGMETDTQTVLRIGRAEDPNDSWRWSEHPVEPDVVLRGNAKLRRWVERECLD